MSEPAPSRRYELLTRIASGGMATVYLGRLRGAAGFSRLVAIKRAHRHISEDAKARRLIVDEARLASRLHHPNVVAVQDVEENAGELLLVMDYVEGGSLAELLRATDDRGERPPIPVVLRILLDAAAGLQAAHALADARGRALELIHRDVSPHNILVGIDGLARLTDFGVAKNVQRELTETEQGALKGKVAYMAPEYLRGEPADARADIFALGVVAWEALSGDRLFQRDNQAATLQHVLDHEVPTLTLRDGISPAIDSVVQGALARERDARFASARAFGVALRDAAAGDIADHAAVGAWVSLVLAEPLAARQAHLRAALGEEPDTPPTGDDRVSLPTASLHPAARAPRLDEITGVTGTRSAAEPTTAAPVSGRPSGSETVSPLPHRSRRALAAGAALLVAIAGALAWLVTGRSHSAASATTSAPSDDKSLDGDPRPAGAATRPAPPAVRDVTPVAAVTWSSAVTAAPSASAPSASAVRSSPLPPAGPTPAPATPSMTFAPNPYPPSP